MTDDQINEIRVKIWESELANVPASQRDTIIEKLKTTNHNTKNIYYVPIEKDKENEI